MVDFYGVKFLCISLVYFPPHLFVIPFPSAVNFTEVNEENKNDLFREMFSSIETLAFTFGNM